MLKQELRSLLEVKDDLTAVYYFKPISHFVRVFSSLALHITELWAFKFFWFQKWSFDLSYSSKNQDNYADSEYDLQKLILAHFCSL